MKALFLAEVPKATMKPLTDNLPKSMLPIMNKPLLERSIINLRRWGIDEIIISTTAKKDPIQQYFGDGKRLGFKIEYLYEEASLGIGSILKNAGSYFKDTFLVIREDVLFDIDITALIQTHQSKSAGITIAVTEANSPCKNDIIEADENGYAVLAADKSKKGKLKSGMIGTGVYVVEPSVLKNIPEGMAVSHISDVFPALMSDDVKIAVYQGCSYWTDMSTPEQYLKIHNDILTGAFQILGVHFNEGSVFKDGKSVIASSAVITGPVYLGDNVKIGAYAIIGPNAVIGDDACIHMGGKVVNSVLWNNVDIGICAKVEGSVAASDCKVKRKAVHTDMAFTKTDSVAWKNR